MYGCESWTIKKAEPWIIDAFGLWCWKKILESPLDSKEIQPVNPKGNQPWICIGRTDAEAPIFWPPDTKSQLFGKDPGAGKDWRQKEEKVTEDEMIVWYYWLNGHEFEQAPGVGDGQGGLECCSSRGHKESDTTEQLNWTYTTWIDSPKMEEREIWKKKYLVCDFNPAPGTNNKSQNLLIVVDSISPHLTLPVTLSQKQLPLSPS